jgi:hypothetical protein
MNVNTQNTKLPPVKENLMLQLKSALNQKASPTVKVVNLDGCLSSSRGSSSSSRSY